jgi:hypothetical protein
MGRGLASDSTGFAGTASQPVYFTISPVRGCDISTWKRHDAPPEDAITADDEKLEVLRHATVNLTGHQAPNPHYDFASCRLQLLTGRGHSSVIV